MPDRKPEIAWLNEKLREIQSKHGICPHCGELQPVEWGGKGKPHGMKWEKEVFCRSCGCESESGDACSECESKDLDVRHLPETGPLRLSGWLPN